LFFAAAWFLRAELRNASHFSVASLAKQLKLHLPVQAQHLYFKLLVFSRAELRNASHFSVASLAKQLKIHLPAQARHLYFKLLGSALFAHYT
jgi:hypothetical protein